MGCLDRRENESTCCRYLWSFFRILRSDLLLTFILIGVVMGFIIGITVNGKVNAITDVEEKKTTVMLIGFPGELFMNMLKLLILPLIVASLVTAVASLDSEASAKIGRRTITYFLSTTIIAVLLGIVLVTLIKPGVKGKSEVDGRYDPKYRTLDSLLDLIRNLFPPNIIEATLNQRQTKYSKLPANYREYNISVEKSKLNTTSGIIAAFNVNATHKIVTVKEMVRRSYTQIPAGTSPVHESSMNILGLVVFSILFGAVLSRMQEKGSSLKMLFECLDEAVMRMVNLVMWYSPIGICSLVAAKLVEMDNILQSLETLGMLMVTTIAGVLIHTFVSLPFIYFIATRKNPYEFMSKMSDALIIAFGTASSAAALPTAIRCAEENLGIDPRITRFVLPLGTTVSMNGAALFQAVGPMWIAQVNNIPMTAEKIITTGILATATSIGTGVPSAGLVTMVIVCDAINVPAEDIGLIFAVDWLIERFRAFCSVMGTGFGAGVVFKLSKEDL